MSTDLYWMPSPKESPPPEVLDTDLKRILARRLWNHDGSLHGEAREVTSALIPYLEGLADGGVDGAAELIAAIREHHTVLIWIEG